MAIECFTHGICTQASERWSFAVLLWEIFTLGGRPYPALEHQQILEHLQAGKRLPQPERCPPAV